MTKSLTKLALAAAVASAPALVAPAAAQVTGAVAVADLNAAIANTAALKTAETQIQTQYKAQIDTFNQRRTAAAQKLEPLAKELQTLQANSATPQATLQQKVTAYRTQEQNLQRELAPLATPFQRPLAYAQEQVAAQLETALRNAMNAKRVGVVLNPQAALLALPASDITADITTQLNALVKTVSITPPANWQPGQQAAATPAAAAPAAGARPAAAPGR